MKKTLVALAALAATGAFAQVSITGGVAWGYLQTSTGSAAGNADASGFGIDTAELDFNVAEDLGGGSKVTGLIQFDTVSRAGVTGGDVVLSYATANAGTLTMSTTKGADYLTGGIAAVGNKGLDGAITSARTYNDAVSYSFPITSSLKVGIAHLEAAKTGNSIGIGAGAAGVDVGEQRRNMVTVDYAAGALVANLGVGSYDQQGVVVAAGPTAGTSTYFKSIVRGALSYDLGVAKLGAGFDSRSYVVGTRMDWAAGVMVPVGQLSLGALWASRTVSDTKTGETDGTPAVATGFSADGTRTGYSLRAKYDLSKQTNILVDYQSYKRKFADTANSTMLEVYLNKSF